MRTLLIAVPLMDWIEGELHPIAMDRIRSSPPLGVYWLAGLLRKADHDAEVLDLIASGTLDWSRISQAAADSGLVAVSCNSLNWPTARLVVNRIKEEFPELPVVVGGIHPTQYPKHVFSSCSADFVIRGEGEVPLLKLVEVLTAGGALEPIPGLSVRGGREDLWTDPEENMLAIDELEGMTDPAFDLLPDGIYETLSVESARGCKFNCSFCSTKFRGSWRGISADKFVDRLERLAPYLDRTLYGIYSFVDDLYTLDIDRVEEITGIIERRGLPVKATLDARATDVIRGRVAESLAPITNHMLIGAECGYDGGLRTIRKGCTTEVLQRAAARVHAVGLAPVTVFSFIIGFPFETRDDCLRTIEFASNLMARYGVRIYLQWFNTIPGSALWNGLEQDGLLDIAEYDEFGFFVNRKLFLAGVRLSLEEIQELSRVISSLNKVMLLTNPNLDVMQFSAPEWLWSESTRDFPSHGYLDHTGHRPSA